MDFKFRDITKLPNILTLGRMALIPVFVIVFLCEDGIIHDDGFVHEHTNGYLMSAGIVILSGLTDALDGWIARHFNMITDLGKALDPLADKLTQAAIVVCLIIRYRCIWWLLVGLFLLICIKEITMLVVGLVFLKKGQDLGGAKWFGKLATIVFYLLVIALIGMPSLEIIPAVIMIGIVYVFTAASFILYMREYFRLYKQREKNDDNG